MAKRKRESTWQQIERRIKEGRGEGVGRDYKPWLYIQDVPSTGRASRIFGWTCGRIHHLMSDLERDYFYILEWAEDVSDIREQFPLLPLEETLSIADELGIRHPMDPKTNEPVVLTTDFLITFRNRNVARTIKPHEELEKDRTLEKFEIERRYWQKRNIEWGIVTDLDIPENIVRNIEWFHKEYQNDDVSHLGVFTVSSIERIVHEQLENGTTLAKATSFCDEKLGLEAGTALAMIKHFLAIKRWRVDMSVRINPGKPLSNITIVNSTGMDFALGG
ncbi:TnsA endonuclease N-terminal domain-containing protein [Effusibacillus lacus]|uniref:Transposase n=1 Tax=Effusibacillus lacus TaxID=1348429 RepID=A0A292YHY9_9BACL|nr:TnsA endonuclease N-terminal domain-containing protein [Effusibacillus lacus]TCS68537.1 TnsA endonuclease-like protein [Effusibacillus lacus]GAX88419.1 transposase [Effusibacillus lacus]